MDDWVALEEGEYVVLQAFVVSTTGSAIALHDPFIEVFRDPSGRRRLTIRAYATSLKLVELLEDTDHLDVLLDLGSRFTYRLNEPRISGGKLFIPNVRSAVQITPASPWVSLERDAFDAEIAVLQLI
jgi:hypothetical protein